MRIRIAKAKLVMLALLGAVVFPGCQGPPKMLPATDLFAVYSPRAEDWDHDGKPDGIRIKLMPFDRTGRVAGAQEEIVFQLYQATDKGKKLDQPPIKTWRLAGKELEEHWVEGALPGYVFRLDWGKLTTEGRSAVLEVVLTSQAGTRCKRTLVLALR